MGIITTLINRLVAPDGLDQVRLGDDHFRDLVNKLDLLLPKPGDYKLSATETADHGPWLKADGRTNILRSSVPANFVTAMLAAGFAGSDGTHIGVPNVVDRFFVGAGGAYGAGAGGGEATHTLTTGEMPSHPHGVTDPGHGHPVNIHDPSHQHPLWGGGGAAAVFDSDPVHRVWSEKVIGLDDGSTDFHPVAFAGGYHNWGPPVTDAAVTSITADTNSEPTGISVNNAGGGGAHNNLPPYRAATVFVYAGL